MSETYAQVKFISENTESLNRVKYYLDSDTRPDFDNEVPKDEIELFKAMEFAEVPNTIKQSTPNIIDAWFEFIELEDLVDIFATFAQFFDIKQFCFFADDEEYKAYFIFTNKELKPIYTIEDNDELDEILWELDWDERAFEKVLEKHQEF